MLVLALSIAWLSFLVSFSMYSGLLVLVLVVRLFQCFILVFSFFSLSVSSSHFFLVLCLIIFFRASFFSFRCHLFSWYCSIISIVFSIHLLSPVVLSFIRELSVFFLYPSSLHYSFHIYFVLHGHKSCFLEEYCCGRSLWEVHCRFHCCVEYLLDLFFFFFCRVPCFWAVGQYWDDCCFDALPYRFHSHSFKFFVSCFW